MNWPLDVLPVQSVARQVAVGPALGGLDVLGRGFGERFNVFQCLARVAEGLVRVAGGLVRVAEGLVRVAEGLVSSHQDG
jgi:hypothetical protein